MSGDTIFAVATGAGRAGVAVVRVSGPAAGKVLSRLAGRAPRQPRLAERARFRDPAGGEPLDDGLCLWFPAPASYTGEDVAELHIHGGRATVEAVLAVLGREPGLRLAEAGEFTRRAFLNGKLDLTAVEGLADLVNAETEAQRRQALRQLDGALGALYEGWRQRLMQALAHLEAWLDFPEEALPDHIVTETNEAARALGAEIAAHLADSRRGEMLRDGVSIAVLGPPNAGKSSLINLLAQREAAIVSTVAGTTRDVVEVHLDLGGYPVIVADTAGLREAGDEIEREGVRRALARAEQADLRIVLIDAGVDEVPDAARRLVDDRTLLVRNKVDLLASPAPLEIAGIVALDLSARTGAGLAALLGRIGEQVAARLADAGPPPLTRARHREALEQCRAALARVNEAAALELAAEDLRAAVRALGRITGRVDVEDLLDIVFRDFCIGK